MGRANAGAPSLPAPSQEGSGDEILILLPGIGTLLLNGPTYRAALAEGARRGHAMGAAAVAAADEPLYEAAQLAEMLKVPPTWLETAARAGRIPSMQFGRWRRFRRSEVEAAARSEPKSP
jgi:excisionase family DNA binding protein